jgi:hypothetical protein
MRRAVLGPPIAWILLSISMSPIKHRLKPQPCTSIEDVSGFYGPGVYWAWILTMISSAFSCFPRDKRGGIPLDFITACLYALASMGDVQLRVCTGCNLKSDLQAQAGLHIAFVALLIGKFTFILSQWTLEKQQPDHREIVHVLWRSRMFQVWAAFLLVIAAQILLLTHSILGIMDSLVTDLLITFFMSLFIFGPHTVPKLLSFIYIWVFLGGPHGRHLRTEPFLWPIFSPRTGAKITDMDQIISLGTTIVALSIQWKVWSRSLEGFSIMRRHLWVKRQDPYSLPLSVASVVT